MKKRHKVTIPVGDVLDVMVCLTKAKSLTRSRGVMRELSTAIKRLKWLAARGTRGNVSVPQSSLLKTLRVFTTLVTWGKDVTHLVHALMAKN